MLFLLAQFAILKNRSWPLLFSYITLKHIFLKYCIIILMLFKRRLPKKADIFIQSNRGSTQKTYYKLFKNFSMVSILLGSLVVLFGTAVFIMPGKQLDSAAQAMIVCPLMPNGGNGHWCNNRWHNHNANDPDNDGDNDNQKADEAITVTPFPTDNFAVNIPTFMPIQTQMPSVQTLTLTTPPSSGQSISGISSQIIAVQQQIGGQMQVCIDNAMKMATQIVALMNQQKQLQAQIDALNNQANNIDTSTQAGQNKQNAINQRIQQLQTQSDNLGTAINNAQNNMNTANSQCQDTVNNLEQNRGQLESNLDDAFTNAMNIQLPNN